MPVPTKYGIRLNPTRDQRRELDRAAKAAGIRNTGPWVLSVALEAARRANARPEPNGGVQVNEPELLPVSPHQP